MTGTVTGLFPHQSVPVIFEPPCTKTLISLTLRNGTDTFVVPERRNKQVPTHSAQHRRTVNAPHFKHIQPKYYAILYRRPLPIYTTS